MSGKYGIYVIYQWYNTRLLQTAATTDQQQNEISTPQRSVTGRKIDSRQSLAVVRLYSETDIITHCVLKRAA